MGITVVSATAKESAFRKNGVLSFMPNLPQFAAILASPSKPIGDLAPNGTIRSDAVRVSREASLSMAVPAASRKLG
jgi:hypothetical protein